MIPPPTDLGRGMLRSDERTAQAAIGRHTIKAILK